MVLCLKELIPMEEEKEKVLKNKGGKKGRGKKGRAGAAASGAQARVALGTVGDGHWPHRDNEIILTLILRPGRLKPTQPHTPSRTPNPLPRKHKKI